MFCLRHRKDFVLCLHPPLSGCGIFAVSLLICPLLYRTISPPCLSLPPNCVTAEETPSVCSSTSVTAACFQDSYSLLSTNMWVKAGHDMFTCLCSLKLYVYSISSSSTKSSILRSSLLVGKICPIQPEVGVKENVTTPVTRVCTHLKTFAFILQIKNEAHTVQKSPVQLKITTHPIHTHTHTPHTTK